MQVVQDSQVTSDRERTVKWQDPVASAQAFMQQPGLAALNAMFNGEHPQAPVQELVGFKLDQVKEGSVSFRFMPMECHFNPIGSVHGGIAGLLLDSAMGASVHSLLPLGVGYTTLEYKINLIRAIRPGAGELYAKGQVINAGKTVVTVEADLMDAAGKIYAHGLSTCLIVR